MSRFTSYFIGIPLPEQFLVEYRQVLEMIGRFYPKLETAFPDCPHITIYYLNDKISDLRLVEKIIRSHVDMLHGVQIKVSGFDFFRPGNPKTLFLDVEQSPILKKFHEALNKDLVRYSAEDNLWPFHLHMSVARINDWPEFDIGEIKLKLTKVRWTFDLTEVAIFGVDSTKRPQYQEKLVSISLNGSIATEKF